ncbi:MAG: hypothetical protein ACLFVL_02480 [Candidatus Aenigmatarchaeota archaeon]
MEKELSEIMQRRFSGDERGVAGFFLDGPVLLLVIITITVFIAILSQAYLAHREAVERERLDDLCLDLKRQVQRHPEMVAEEENRTRSGELSVKKLNELDNQTLIEELDLNGGYDFRIIVNDTGSRDTWVFGNERRELEGSEVTSYRGPILLISETGDTRIGELRVIVWEG